MIFNFKKLKLLIWVKLSKSLSKKTSNSKLIFKFNNVSDVDSNMIFLISKIKETKEIHNIDNQEDGYIKGFKEGCEYALKLKG